MTAILSSTRPGSHSWTDLLQSAGPWLTIPVLEGVLPDGPARVPTGIRHRLRAAVAETSPTGAPAATA